MLSLDNNSLVLLVPFSAVRWCANCLVQNADIQTTPYSVETRRDFSPQGYMAEKGIEEHHLFLLLGGSMKLVCTRKCHL